MLYTLFILDQKPEHFLKNSPTVFLCTILLKKQHLYPDSKYAAYQDLQVRSPFQINSFIYAKTLNKLYFGYNLHHHISMLWYS